MSSWMNDAAVQNHNGAAFNHLNDPNTTPGMLDPSAFMANPSSFDPSQFQNPQLQQRMQNGAMRNSSPSYSQPVYQTNQVIPSKRPRPREESLGTSPRQAAGMLPNSRSQTPQQQSAYNNQAGFAPQQPGPYSHLQNGSANASPSPIMANQLRPGGVPQRVSTASPHPFSPAGQQFVSHGSPSQSDHGGRTETPQNNNPYAPQNPAFNPNFNQNFTPPAGRTSAPPQSGMSTPQMPQSHMQPQMFNPQPQPPPPQQRPQNTLEQQKMLYQMRLQQQLQQGNLLAAQRAQNMSPSVNPSLNPQMPGPNGQLPNMRAQPSAAPRGGNPDQFVKNLTAFMQSKQMPLDMNPIVGDRPINLVMLYMAVQKYGGYRKVSSQQNGWVQVAQALQFHIMHNQAAPHQIKGHYERNLLAFEEAWQSQQQQRQRAAMMQQGQGGNMPGQGPQMSPTKQMNPNQMQQAPQYMAQLQQQQQQQQQQQHQQQRMAQQQMQQQPHSTPVKQMSVPPAMNGFSTPQAPPSQHSMGPQTHARNSLSRSIESTPPQNGTAFPMPSPAPTSKPGSISLQSPPETVAAPVAPLAPQEHNLPEKLDPKVRVIDTFGGVEFASLLKLGAMVTQWKPDIPAVADLGTIDIHALTMSLQSNIHAEVRLALDTLVSMSVEVRLQLDLRACEDLVETLIDCAELQVDFLAENAAEVSDVMLVTSYEDVVRGCRLEKESLQEIPPFGSLGYDLDRAVDKLICITTIIRNLSFFDANHTPLADELVIKFFCVVVRYLGTRNMLLRTHSNTLDFMKDVIIYLSNLAQDVELPGREQALCLLHFVLAFAPSPVPNSAGPGNISFSSFDPTIHRYLPAAVDSLAKLLARDEPNRTYYKTIFASDVASSPPFDLLTRTFALAISPVPDLKQDSKRGNLPPVIEQRKPYLMQGMLAAEILSNLAPGYETGLPKSWLTSEDGWSQNLSRLILSLCSETPTHLPHNGRGQPPPPKGIEDEALLHISLGGIAVLRRLAEKSRDPDNATSFVPTSGMPTKDSLLGALKIAHPRLQGVLKQLCVYAGLDT
ncbi:arid bright dna binding domain containing protein [Phlyctema vagabunda]|uniref:Arid bright dna binding domain containing protein n=1 Tax=Phlyctema vagabunda TaxID=108571 RepID=A0ABR4PSL3_9HELO